MADRGIYVCRAENVAGRAQDYATVEVEREYISRLEKGNVSLSV